MAFTNELSDPITTDSTSMTEEEKRAQWPDYGGLGGVPTKNSATFKVVGKITLGGGFYRINGNMVPMQNFAPKIGDVIVLDKSRFIPEPVGETFMYRPSGYPYRIVTDDNGDGEVTIPSSAVLEVEDKILLPLPQTSVIAKKTAWPFILVGAVILFLLIRKKSGI